MKLEILLWKLQLKLPYQSLPINTKIEFSRRKQAEDFLTEMVSRKLILMYQLRPLFISHYNVDMALLQKITALAFRNETQARDVFDIYHLIQMHDITLTKRLEKHILEMAHSRALDIRFAEFNSQVVSYLEADYQVQYSDPNLWDTILLAVCDYLKRQIL